MLTQNEKSQRYEQHTHTHAYFASSSLASYNACVFCGRLTNRHSHLGYLKQRTVFINTNVWGRKRKRSNFSAICEFVCVRSTLCFRTVTLRIHKKLPDDFRCWLILALLLVSHSFCFFTLIEFSLNVIICPSIEMQYFTYHPWVHELCVGLWRRCILYPLRCCPCAAAASIVFTANAVVVVIVLYVFRYCSYLSLLFLMCFCDSMRKFNILLWCQLVR